MAWLSISPEERPFFNPPLESTPQEAAVNADNTTPSQTPLPLILPEATAFEPFFDTFDDNRNNWSLGNGATIEDGALSIARDTFVVIPGIDAENFYLEVDIEPDNCRLVQDEASIGLGDYSNGGNWHRIYFVISYLSDYIELNYIADGEQQKLNDFKTRFVCAGNRIGIQYQDGDMEIYVDDELIGITQVIKEGNDIILDGSASFDNIVIRESR